MSVAMLKRSELGFLVAALAFTVLGTGIWGGDGTGRCNKRAKQVVRNITWCNCMFSGKEGILKTDVNFKTSYLILRFEKHRFIRI